MKIVFLIILGVIANSLYAGAIREGLVRKIEQKFLYIPSEIMTDKGKSMFLTHLYLEISDNDEYLILQTYKDMVSLLGMDDPLGLISYIKEQDAQALEKMEDRSSLSPPKAMPKKDIAPNNLQHYLKSIKDANEERERLLKDDDH
ncbi:MAG: hypothetical protein A2381_00380 [Bdellovibrionales bacterium RIFOXYB1_FULL_37_110]|nr:MAG: hypothetical protein A2417_11435 [Bdellovibrionales bacterium RIFOXYC1_FULL_37_79]OFZ60850.1 MAG: hypothetical protein A2381_00380 [Bdellovibrionales bacterium RIFOXYB1_FULL_37_110]OFZ62380.1 MAG: hypothetical protein A2577_03045 [Bdellovibrionales bacterium RIFOXYD1_FULL_36_51]